MSPEDYIELANTGHFSFLEAAESAADIIKS